MMNVLSCFLTFNERFQNIKKNTRKKTIAKIMDGDCMYEASHEDNELLRIIGDGLSGTKTFS